MALRRDEQLMGLRQARMRATLVEKGESLSDSAADFKACWLRLSGQPRLGWSWRMVEQSRPRRVV